MKPVGRLALAAAAAALAAGAVWTQVHAARAERDFPARGAFVEVEGARLHHVDRGSGAPIVLLHGAYGGIEDWTATGIVDELARTHRVIAFDRPGHGWSERASVEPMSPIEQARVLRAACRALGVERPLLVGFSWSGALVLAWAIAWPDEIAGVLTVNGVAYAWPGATNTSYVVAGLPLVGPALAYTLAAPFGDLSARASIERAFDPAPVPASFASAPIPLALRPRQFLVETADLRVLKPAVAIVSARYGEIRVPLEILAARGDRVAHWDWHSERLHRAVPTSGFTVIEDAGHQILHSHPRAVIDAVGRLDARATNR